MVQWVENSATACRRPLAAYALFSNINFRNSQNRIVVAGYVDLCVVSSLAFLIPNLNGTKPVLCDDPFHFKVAAFDDRIASHNKIFASKLRQSVKLKLITNFEVPDIRCYYKIVCRNKVMAGNDLDNSIIRRLRLEQLQRLFSHCARQFAYNLAFLVFLAHLRNHSCYLNLFVGPPKQWRIYRRGILVSIELWRSAQTSHGLLNASYQT